MLETIEDPPGVFCSLLSRQADEDLFGTATQTSVYFMLEYNGIWGKKAFEGSGLADAIKMHLSAVQQTTPASKLLLIRSRSGLLEPGVSFFVAVASEHDPALYAFQLKNYEDLLALDLPGLLASTRPYADNRREEPVFLICTNGKRDPCCAKFGYPVYLEIAKENRGNVWQCTHVGGHRFAANLLCFPHGLLYGRLEALGAAQTVKAYRTGQIDLAHYRGRTCYAPATQAAEYFLRRETGRLGLDDFRLQEDGPNATGEWEARIIDTHSGLTHRVTVVPAPEDEKVYDSCRQDKTTKRTKWKRKGPVIIDQ